jgi:uncharacterized membrane protein YphA (DoxX/SURF4 family)
MQAVIHWILRGVAALILLQTLFFKFTGAEESVFIFSTLGVEPVGRIGSGIVELIAGLCLLYRPAVWLGALLALGTMTGAILSHIFVLGIEIMHDGGQLFAYALVVFVCSFALLFWHRKEIPVLSKILFSK